MSTLTSTATSEPEPEKGYEEIAAEYKQAHGAATSSVLSATSTPMMDVVRLLSSPVRDAARLLRG